MRALAASSVLVFHVWQQAAPGGKSVDLGDFGKLFDMLSAGVALFFVLSGFLLFRPFVAAALHNAPAPSIRAYLFSRLMRIGPAYITIVLVTILFFEHEIRDNVGRALANVFLVQYYVPAYVAPELHQGNGGIAIVPSWSLAVEVAFYLLLPLLGVAAIQAALRRGVSPVVAVLAPVGVMALVGIASMITARALPPSPFERVWDFSFLAHADWFAWGMALALLRVLWEDGRLRLPSHWRPGAVVTTVGLTFVAVKLYYSGGLTRLETQSVLALGCALLLALVVLDPRDGRALRVLCSKPIVAVGLASYSVFLWHDPLLRVLRDHGLTESSRFGFLENLLLVAAVTGVAATLTYLFVEKPALARSAARRRSLAHDLSSAPAPTGALQASEATMAPTATAAQPVELSEALLLRVRQRKLTPQQLVLRDEVCQLAAELAPDRIDDIVVAVPPELEIPGDRFVLHEILGALIRNALLYGEPPLVITAGMRGGSLRLAVEDSGRGVSSDFVPRLFEPYSRSEISSTEAAGTGLGLAVARAYAGLHHGTLHFEPLQPHGAGFYLVLPTPKDESELGPPRPQRSSVADSMRGLTDPRGSSGAVAAA